jgi:transcriptional regulator with XRE-family HTH domain
MTTGELLRAAIEAKWPDKTQGEIADLLHVPAGTLSEWLGDKYEPSLESMRQLARRLSKDVASLIGTKRKRRAS